MTLKRPRKPGPRQLERMQQAFTAAVDRAARELGAVQDDYFGYAYRIETKAGPLHFRASPAYDGKGGQLVSRFNDVARACELLNPEKRLGSYSGLNPFSGKWNLMLYDATPEHVYERVLSYIRPVLPR